MEQPLLLVLAFVVILLGAELFTNGIEWVGHHLDRPRARSTPAGGGRRGTARDDDPLVAILLGGNAADASDTADGIGVGADRARPSCSPRWRVRDRRRGAASPPAGGDDTMPVDTRVIGKDVTWFLGAYALAVGTAFLPPGSRSSASASRCCCW
ncbi:MAG: hypothetical protein U0869_13470 [Chloroflexota bacterium]